jgi:formate hydrogenlyase subunit 6/NADH:ubiquinone oxidoreductase subunit I
LETKNRYWKDFSNAITTLSRGMALTASHFLNSWRGRRASAVFDENYFEQQKGIATVQYPHETIPIPDQGRYRLHNEIDDCIVCDKCVKICPVDCIEIEPIRSPVEFGKTSDGTPRRIYAAKFDINMGKCCFCGLCTTVCPTECLTMTKTFDFSSFNILDHTVSFATMTPAEIEEKKKAWEAVQRTKEQAAAQDKEPGS